MSPRHRDRLVYCPYTIADACDIVEEINHRATPTSRVVQRGGSESVWTYAHTVVIGCFKLVCVVGAQHVVLERCMFMCDAGTM